MDFNKYQIKAHKTAIFPTQIYASNNNNNMPYLYPALGLAGESGEVVEKIKRIMRDDKCIIREERLEEISKEVGDVLWYLSELCSSLGISLDYCASNNIQKLQDRKDRNVIKGEGDNR